MNATRFPLKNGCLYLLLLISYTLNAQLITVRDKQTQATLGFASISAPSRLLGTLTDSAGRADLSRWQLAETDTLHISFVGYHPLRLILNDNNDKVIEMEENSLQLAAVTVTAPNAQSTTWGIHRKSMVMAGFKKNNKGAELATVMLNNRKGYISDISFRVAKNKYDSVLFRVNVYELVNGIPGALINKQPIYCMFRGKRGEQTVDLTTFNLEVDGPYVIALEWIQNLDAKGLYFYASWNEKVSYSRSFKEENWESLPMGISISSQVMSLPEENK